MVIDNIRVLLGWIFVLVLLLGVCITVDYADPTISNTGKSVDTNDTNQVFLLNESEANLTVSSSDEVHTVPKEKKSLPIVSMWARPSVRCGLPYQWYYRSFVDYCPHCHRYGVLYDAHKPQARYEHEWTCKNCGADYDAVVGKEKYDWSSYYLRSA